jgi:catechol 2,3-dioxygenase-like lactoylglutathione lyase family enzyme
MNISMSAFPPVVHLAVTVRDLDQSIAWYETLFGVPPLFVGDEATYRFAVWLEPMFALHEHDGRREVPVFDEYQTGLDHIAFGCANREELEGWLVRLDNLGIKHGQIVEAFYGTGLAFRDPDNIQLEFFVNPR